MEICAIQVDFIIIIIIVLCCCFFQASLLTQDESKALSPKQLQNKLSAMLEQHPDIAEAVSLCP
jgi:hypothetical protein